MSTTQMVGNTCESDDELSKSVRTLTHRPWALNVHKVSTCSGRGLDGSHLQSTVFTLELQWRYECNSTVQGDNQFQATKYVHETRISRLSTFFRVFEPQSYSFPGAHPPFHLCLVVSLQPFDTKLDMRYLDFLPSTAVFKQSASCVVRRCCSFNFSAYN